MKIALGGTEHTCDQGHPNSAKKEAGGSVLFNIIFIIGQNALLIVRQLAFLNRVY